MRNFGFGFSRGLPLLVPIPAGPLTYDELPSKVSAVFVGMFVICLLTSDFLVVAAVIVFCNWEAYRV